MNDGQDQILDAGWMVDGTGAPVRRSVRLTLRGRWIARIDTIASENRPAGGNWQYPSDTLMPGLIDAHLHLCMSPTNDPEARQRQLSEPYDTAEEGMRRRIRRMTAHGIVAARDAGDAAGCGLRFRRECLPDENNAFCLHAAGAGWHARGRYGRFVGRPPADGLSLADAVTRETTLGDHLKIINSGINSLAVFGRQTPPQFSRADLAAAVAAAGRRGVRAMVHANGRQAVGDAVASGAHSIEHGYFMGTDIIGLLADAQIHWVPTVVPMAVHASRALGAEKDIAARSVDHQLAQIATAHRAGARLVVGTDAGGVGVSHGAAILEEIALFLQAGVPLSAVIRAATGAAAELMGLTGLGVLAPGKRACLVVVPGPPEALPGSLKHIKLLLIDGKPVL
ncbi:MAG: amidohydrolase family protein [Pseudomonadota bacterium]